VARWACSEVSTRSSCQEIFTTRSTRSWPSLPEALSTDKITMRVRAQDFARRYALPLDQYCAPRMEKLGIPDDKICSACHGAFLIAANFRPTSVST
jgi:hypothetical protein